MKKILFACFSVLIFSCNKNSSHIAEYDYELKEAKHRLSYNLESSTRYEFTNLFPYIEKDKEYLTFASDNEILFYDLQNGDLLFKTEIEPEGPNGVNGFYGYHIEDMNHIYLTSCLQPFITQIDTSGSIKKKIKYGKTKSDYNVTPTFESTSFFNTPLVITNGQFYITQKPSFFHPMSKTPVSIMIDTLNHTINELPFLFPPLFKDDELGTFSATSSSFSRDFNGNEFVYSFYFKENIYVASLDHKEIRQIPAKSKYISHLEIEKLNEDMYAGVKREFETANYGNMYYDKYRKVYYRMAYPEINLDNNKDINYVKLTCLGRIKFSIIIMDEHFNIIGETLFPEYQYCPSVLFVHKDGLYICNNNPMEVDFNEDILSFSCFELVKK